MDIYTFKKQFKAAMQPENPSLPLEQTWEVFKQFLIQQVEQEYCEEFSFGTGLVSRKSEDRYQIYFGRLIDAVKECRWQTAEINLYIEYKMDPAIRQLLPELPAQDIEDATRISDDQALIRQKLEGFIDAVDQLIPLFHILQNRTPVLREIQFYLQ
jgi:hypothetical protein